MILVRNPNAEHDGCRILYRDIGDYLKREEKLTILRDAGSIAGIEDWREITPNQHNDWIGQRDEAFPKALSDGIERGEGRQDRRSDIQALFQRPIDRQATPISTIFHMITARRTLVRWSVIIKVPCRFEKSIPSTRLMTPQAAIPQMFPLGSRIEEQSAPAQGCDVFDEQYLDDSVSSIC